MLIISYFTKNLGPYYFSAVDQILRYLASSPKKVLNLEKNLNFSLLNTQTLTEPEIISIENQNQDLFSFSIGIYKLWFKEVSNCSIIINWSWICDSYFGSTRGYMTSTFFDRNKIITTRSSISRSPGLWVKKIWRSNTITGQTVSKTGWWGGSCLQTRKSLLDRSSDSWSSWSYTVIFNSNQL